MARKEVNYLRHHAAKGEEKASEDRAHSTKEIYLLEKHVL